MPDDVLGATLHTKEQMPFTKTVRLSEGEPTLHPRFHEVAQRLMAMGKRVVVYTNGWWAETPEKAVGMYEKLYEHSDPHSNGKPASKLGWTEIRVSFNNDLLKAQPDTLDRIVNIADASHEYLMSKWYLSQVPDVLHRRKDGYFLTQFSVSTRGDDEERYELEDRLYDTLMRKGLNKLIYKTISLPFVKAGRSTEGITVQPREQAEDSKLLLVNPEGTVFASRVEAHESLGVHNYGESRVGKITNADFTERLKSERVARFER